MRSLIAGLVAVLLATSAHAGVLDASWDAPQTNVDGSNLADLDSYRVYWALFPQAPCSGTQFLVAPAVALDPAPGTRASLRLTNLTQGFTYNVQVTAVNTSGRE